MLFMVSPHMQPAIEPLDVVRGWSPVRPSKLQSDLGLVLPKLALFTLTSHESCLQGQAGSSSVTVRPSSRDNC